MQNVLLYVTIVLSCIVMILGIFVIANIIYKKTKLNIIVSVNEQDEMISLTNGSTISRKTLIWNIASNHMQYFYQDKLVTVFRDEEGKWILSFEAPERSEELMETAYNEALLQQNQRDNLVVEEEQEQPQEEVAVNNETQNSANLQPIQENFDDYNDAPEQPVKEVKPIVKEEYVEEIVDEAQIQKKTEEVGTYYKQPKFGKGK